ncbi:MAG: SRPBCC family protein [Actinomycetes bacterium]
MPQFTLTRHINASVEQVWAVLDNFGEISRWNPGVKHSSLTSEGPVSQGSTRHCDLAPFGGVNERIDSYIPNERMTVDIYEAFKLPISDAIADFNLAAREGGTELTLHYSYTLNRLGRVAKGTTTKQLEKGIGGLADSLKEESERVAAH